jgi:hypothetical protein
MAKRSTSSPRPRDAARGKTKGRHTKRQFRWLATLRWLVPLLIGIAVFVAGLIFDTSALLHLARASLAGSYGLAARLGVILLLAACVAPAVIGLYRWLAEPVPLPTPPRKKTQAKTTKPRAPRRAKAQIPTQTGSTAAGTGDSEPAPPPEAADPVMQEASPNPRRRASRVVRPPRPTPR